MNLIEHLEYVIGLVDRSAANAEIKGALVAMHQEVEGQERATKDQGALNKKHADQIAALQNELSAVQQAKTEVERKLEEMKTQQTAVKKKELDDVMKSFSEERKREIQRRELKY